MKFINLCGKKHPVVIYNKGMGAQELVIPPSGEARLDSKLIRVGTVTDDATGMPVPLIAFDGDCQYGLPNPREGIMYIVSREMRMANPDRMDLASPDVTASEAVFDHGEVVSVPGLVVNSRRS